MSTEKLSAEQTVTCTATRGVERCADVAAGVGVSRRSGVAATGRWFLFALPLVFALYVRAVGFAAVYDDNVASPWNSLRDVPKFFTHDIFGFDGHAHSVYYRPLPMTWGLLVGLVSNGAIAWPHLSAILLHMAVMALAYVFGRHLFRDNRLAFLTAILFALHPSKVESVAWVGSSNVDGLGAVFFFATLIAFLKWCESKSAGWMAASVIFFAGAMFTKETMVCIPMLLAIYLWLTIPREGRIPRIVRTLLPYGMVWGVYMAIRHVVIRPASASAEYYRPTFTLTNVWTAPYAILWYIRHLVMPWGLSVEYAENTLEHPTLSGFVLPAVGLLLLLIASLWLWSRWHSKVAAFLMFWFVLTLAPPVIVAPMVHEHDRYLYLASYAFCALVAWMILQLRHLSAKACVMVALCVVLLWSGMTWHEMGYWDTEATLWPRSLEISPSSLMAQLHTAVIYREAGDTVKALGVLNDGLRYRPNNTNLWVVRSQIFQADKQLDEARAGYLNVMRLTEPTTVPQDAADAPTERAVATSMRTVAAYELAVLDFSTKDWPEAEHYAQIAVTLNPKDPHSHMALERSLREQGRVAEADDEKALVVRLWQQADKQNHHP